MKKSLLILLALLLGSLAWAQEATPSKVSVTVNGVTFKMVQVEGGYFNMGGTAEHLANGFYAQDDEYPIHVVKLDDYWMAETEVTQQLWAAVMGDNPSGFQGDLNLPVERVMWIECQTFIEKLNELTGMTFRLPTESEWEYAARGGKYTHNYVYSGSNNIDEVAWHDGDCTRAVAQLQPNELGIYDMSGNVFEWCQDWFADYDMMPAENPTGPESGENRVRRGGSWGGSNNGPRVAFRNYELPNIRFNYIGFRLAANEVVELSNSGISTATMSERQHSDQRYNVMGQKVNEDYHGIVIKDGQVKVE